jgi:hypothetical protein
MSHAFGHIHSIAVGAVIGVGVVSLTSLQARCTIYNNALRGKRIPILPKTVKTCPYVQYTRLVATRHQRAGRYSTAKLLAVIGCQGDDSPQRHKEPRRTQRGPVSTQRRGAERDAQRGTREGGRGLTTERTETKGRARERTILGVLGVLFGVLAVPSVLSSPLCPSWLFVPSW